jgi:uncharacterized protein YqjF (DUF2071 family)
MKKFLTAKWQDLIMANYEVEPSLLESRLPAGTSLDLHEGKCFISLVGFMFLDTRVLDFLVPFHVNFEEVNLRFYVVRETEDEVRRGVVFVKEIVPKAAIAAVARTLYGEPYERWAMSNERSGTHVGYNWSKGSCSNSVTVTRGENLGVPAADSHGEFIIEHYWGYTKRGQNRTDEYRVEHPKWEIFDAADPQIDVDFGCTYGADFAFLSDQKPFSILLAKGSEIAVYKGKPIHY